MHFAVLHFSQLVRHKSSQTGGAEKAYILSSTTYSTLYRRQKHAAYFLKFSSPKLPGFIMYFN